MLIQDKKNELIIKEIQKLKKELNSLEKELQQLIGNDSPLIQISAEKERLVNEEQELKETIRTCETSQQKFHDSILALGADLDMLESECINMKNEKEQMQHCVDSQEISPADVDRMNSERDQLVKALSTTSQKMDTFNSDIWEKEIQIQKKMDLLEKLVQNYNSRAFKLEVLGSEIPEFGQVKHELELHIHAARPEKMVSVDLKNAAKPTFNNLKIKFNNQLHKYEDDKIAIQEALDAMHWSIAQKTEELADIESQIQILSERYKEEKEVT